MSRARWSEAEVDHLRELHAEGLSCGAASERLGRPLSSTSQKARSLGLKWPSELPPEVRAGREVAIAAVRSEVVEGMYHLAGKLLTRALEDADGFDDLIRGEGGAEVFARLPRIPTRAARDLASAAASLARGASAVEAAMAATASDNEMDRYLDWMAGAAMTEGANVGQPQTTE